MSEAMIVNDNREYFLKENKYITFIAHSILNDQFIDLRLSALITGLKRK